MNKKIRIGLINHAEITCAALRAGKWAICEKPVGGSIKEANDILAAERETGIRAAAISREDPYFGNMPWKITSSDVNLQKEIDACLERWNTCPCPEGDKGQLLHFVRAYRNRFEPVVNIGEAKRCLELIAGIYKSAITGEKTTFPIATDAPFYSSMNGGQTLRGAIKK